MMMMPEDKPFYSRGAAIECITPGNLSPLRGFATSRIRFPGLTPGATFFRRSAAIGVTCSRGAALECSPGREPGVGVTMQVGAPEGRKIPSTLSPFRRSAASVLLLVLIGTNASAQIEFFETRIRPLLAQQCFSCHTDEKMGGLRLDSKESVLKGGTRGPAVVPGEPDKSLLLDAVRQTGELRMPKGGQHLTDTQIQDLTTWIKDGAYWPELIAKTPAAEKEFFESRIRPLLAQQCFVCHTNSKMGGLRLDSRDDILKGGKSGPAIVPGDTEKSLLLAAVRHSGELKMPKGAARLTDAQIQDLTSWIKDGAFWPVENATTRKFTEEQTHLWSIQALHAPDLPKVKDAAWPINDLDRFVLARLEKECLKPAPTTDRRTLLRRVTYGLTGLAPTYEEVKAFESDKSPNAYEKVIDRLLASPRYGERWA